MLETKKGNAVGGALLFPLFCLSGDRWLANTEVNVKGCVELPFSRIFSEPGKFGINYFRVGIGQLWVRRWVALHCQEWATHASFKLLSQTPSIFSDSWSKPKHGLSASV